MRQLQRHPAGRRAALAASVLFAAALTGCVIAPLGPPYAHAPAGEAYGDIYADAPPPPPQYEVIGAPPVVGHIWIGGHWGWRAGRHAWIGGRWAAPRHGHRWVPHGWAPHGPRWRLGGGYWSR